MAINWDSSALESFKKWQGRGVSSADRMLSELIWSILFFLGTGAIREADDGQHLQRMHYDNVRTKYLESFGYHVLCFWNNEVISDIEAVLERIAINFRNKND